MEAKNQNNVEVKAWLMGNKVGIHYENSNEPFKFFAFREGTVERILEWAFKNRYTVTNIEYGRIWV